MFIVVIQMAIILLQVRLIVYDYYIHCTVKYENVIIMEKWKEGNWGEWD